LFPGRLDFYDDQGVTRTPPLKELFLED